MIMTQSPLSRGRGRAYRLGPVRRRGIRGDPGGGASHRHRGARWSARGDLIAVGPWRLVGKDKLNGYGETKPARVGGTSSTLVIGAVGCMGPSAFVLGTAKLILSGYIRWM